MNAQIIRWVPAVVLGLGALFTVGVDSQRTMPLRAPLEESIPFALEQHQGKDIVISEDEQRVAGMTNYLMRAYEPAAGSAAGAAGFSLYVGYYESQTQGKTIHSPKNCLPGAGWEALTSKVTTIATAAGPVAVNQYLLQRNDERALVLYWYQGRGRVEANEYTVKWDLLRDAAFHGRSEEALVRIIVPVATTESDALAFASRIASQTIPAVEQALPEGA